MLYIPLGVFAIYLGVQPISCEVENDAGIDVSNYLIVVGSYEIFTCLLFLLCDLCRSFTTRLHSGLLSGFHVIIGILLFIIGALLFKYNSACIKGKNFGLYIYILISYISYNI